MITKKNPNFNRQENWKPNSPCYKCSDRYVGCHSSCAKYISYQQELDAKRKEVYENKEGAECHEYRNYIIKHHQDRNRKKFKYGD